MTLKQRQWLVAALVAAAALVAGLYFGRSEVGQDNARAEAALHALVMKDDDGRTLSLSELRGKAVVLNFWATWCAPCREETPAFMRAQAELGPERVQFIGLAIDQPQPVAAFKQEFGVTYPIVILGMEGVELMRAVGNNTGALPFTVVLDAQGKVRGRHLGVLDQRRIEGMVREALPAR